jgi:hypothetical protein
LWQSSRGGGWFSAWGLYADRLNADYDLDKGQVERVEYARMRVETARRIQSALEACDSDEARDEIKTGIADYQRRISGK